MLHKKNIVITSLLNKNIRDVVQPDRSAGSGDALAWGSRIKITATPVILTTRGEVLLSSKLE